MYNPKKFAIYSIIQKFSPKTYILQIESNALRKSMKEQNNFIFLASSISIKECNAKMWSVVE